MEIEHGTLTPLVYSLNGGMGPECTKFHKHLANKIAEKTGNNYDKVLTLIRTKLSFLILRAAILCVRGSRSISSRNVESFGEDYDMILGELCIL